MIFLKIIFFSCLFLILHSYLFYPFTLLLIDKIRKKANPSKLLTEEELPFISTITSVYNEDKIIHDKIKSLTESDYPREKLKIYVGSDASSDRSDQILAELQKNIPLIQFVKFEKRRGKTSVINDLMQCAAEHKKVDQDHVFVFTDANVILRKDTLRRLAEKFTSPEIGLVDSRIIPKSSGYEGVAEAESRYIGLETHIKHLEGKLWGMMMVLGTFLIIPCVDWILSRVNIHITILRAVRYFLFMNIALLLGFVKYLRGIKHSIWEPPKRNNLS